ncbi:MAG: Ig-like domain-containing protein [Candidatus Bipolaricaulota bacterium]|nr:Ig-like domain-containing protein [Candidatus Bipolaricaulota bacterium]MDW8030985.1 Ig-like domain-containing protein [Candidatus Bipolaricaulota bacterium]
MTALLKRGLGLTIVVLVLGLISCTTTGPTVTLSGPAGPYVIGEGTVTLTATGSPGSSAGLWTYSFSAACGTFSPATTPPANQTTVTTVFTPTTEVHNCVITVTLTTASGRKATASITRSVGVRPTVVSVTPANSSSNVLVTSEISVTFSHPMDPASLVLTCTGEHPGPGHGGPWGTCNMTISGPTGSGAGPYTWTVGDPDATPSTNLQYGRAYRLEVSGRRAPSFLIPMATPYVFAFDTELPPTGGIVINKTAVGGDATFNYSSNIPGYSTFSITTSGGSGSQTFSGLTPGPYTVEETLPLPPGWSFTSLVCTDPDGGTNVSARTAYIDLDAGETVICTYTNTYTPPVMACPTTPVITESEPANNLPGSQTLTLTPGNPASAGFTARVSGTLPVGDKDQYSFSVGAGTWLVFAYVRTDRSTGTSPDDTVIAIGTAPFTGHTSGCTWTPAATECDDEDGGQRAPSPADSFDPSSIAARSITGPATVYIAVSEWDSSFSIMSPGYRLYIAVVPVGEVVPESEPANNTAAGAPEITKCPYVVQGVQNSTAAENNPDYVRFNIDFTSKSVWASMGWATTGVLNAHLDLTLVSPLTDLAWPNATPAQFGGTAGNCDSSGTSGTPAPPSESCSFDPGYGVGDTWPATGYYAAGPATPVSATATGATYYFLIVVWP